MPVFPGAPPSFPAIPVTPLALSQEGGETVTAPQEAGVHTRCSPRFLLCLL